MPPGLLSLDDEPDLPENDDVFLLYSNKSCVTGRNLARYLGVPHGKSCDERYDRVVRWGSSRGVSYIPNVETINTKAATERTTDKLEAMRRFRDAGVEIPPFSTHTEDLEYPILGRSRNHTQGNDINLILQDRDRRLTDNDFYVEYVPTELEYRAHVMNGEVFKVHEKRLRHEADNHPYIRNAETGWVFVNPREDPPDENLATAAVGSLGLDFGAVDIIRGEDGTEYVLEVNTAPSCDEANLERYGENLAQRLELDEYPGMDHPDIEFPDDEEDND